MVCVSNPGSLGTESAEEPFESELSPFTYFGPLLLSGDVLRLRFLRRETRPYYLVCAGKILDTGDLCCDEFTKPKFWLRIFSLPMLCLVVLQPLRGDMLELYSTGVLKFWCWSIFIEGFIFITFCSDRLNTSLSSGSVIIVGFHARPDSGEAPVELTDLTNKFGWGFSLTDECLYLERFANPPFPLYRFLISAMLVGEPAKLDCCSGLWRLFSSSFASAPADASFLFFGNLNYGIFNFLAVLLSCWSLISRIAYHVLSSLENLCMNSWVLMEYKAPSLDKHFTVVVLLESLITSSWPSIWPEQYKAILMSLWPLVCSGLNDWEQIEYEELRTVSCGPMSVLTCSGFMILLWSAWLHFYLWVTSNSPSFTI